MRPHFRPSTKHARRTGDIVQSISVKLGHFRGKWAEVKGVPSFFRPIRVSRQIDKIDRGFQNFFTFLKLNAPTSVFSFHWVENFWYLSICLSVVSFWTGLTPILPKYRLFFMEITELD